MRDIEGSRVKGTPYHHFVSDIFCNPSKSRLFDGHKGNGKHQSESPRIEMIENLNLYKCRKVFGNPYDFYCIRTGHYSLVFCRSTYVLYPFFNVTKEVIQNKFININYFDSGYINTR